jgi:hypothetical protein
MLNTNIMLMGVYKDMISYYTPLGPLKSMAGAKYKPVSWRFYFICSFFRGCGCILRFFLGVTVGMIVTVGFFIIMDWWTGSAASHTTIIARNKGYG